jgi:Zn-dependent protease
MLFQVLNMGIFINLSLGVFNLIPFPPLDGFWLLKGVLPKKITAFLTKIQIWGFVLIIIALQTKMFMVFLYPIFALGALSLALINALLG